MLDSIIHIGIFHFLLLAFILFIIGLLGLFVNNKSIISLLMSIELIFLAININFVVFSTYLNNMLGQIDVLIIVAVSAMEVSIGLTIVVILFTKLHSIWVDEPIAKEYE